MNKFALSVIPMLLLTACSPQKTLTPWTDNFNESRDAAIAPAARNFIVERQGCDHFRGEPGYDEARRKFLTAQIKKLCSGTDKQLEKLRLQFADSPETVKALAEFEDCIEYASICSATEAE
ncbi:MAG: hypothetical protein V7676_08435 [Parasphingorhabdus sp.]|uniref:hypothetical protein n=1 Tax=Parasphingorhabdus sp. TaxID=2709688 RepID=UPI003001F0BE